MGWVLSLFSFCRQGNWGPERLSDLAMGTYLKCEEEVVKARHTLDRGISITPWVWLEGLSLQKWLHQGSRCHLQPFYLPSLNSMSFQVAPLHFLSCGEWMVIISKKQGFSNKLKEKEWRSKQRVENGFYRPAHWVVATLYGFASKDPCLLGGHRSAWCHSFVGSCSKNSSVGKREQTLTSNPDRSSVTLAHCLCLSLSLPQGSFSLPFG